MTFQLARRRPCSFSKNGSVDQLEIDDFTTTETPLSPSPPRSRASTPLMKTTATTTTSPKDAKQIMATTEVLNRLTKALPGEGKEGKWELDQTKLRRINKQAIVDYNDYSINLPSKVTQQRLIQLYFKHAYSMFPIIPKQLFYQQFDSPNHQVTSASYLLSPLLLLMVFAHGATCQNLEEEADTYFHHAKSIVLGRSSLLHKPKLSTVIALALMSLYESRENPNATLYSALAFQMCLDLDLMRDYSGNLERSTDINEDDEDGGTVSKELRKRVCWGCYTLDKVIHIQSGQPWMLRSKDIELDMPLLQPGDDVAEHGVLEGFVATIKLLQIAERILQPESLQQIGQPVVRTHTHDQMSLNQDNILLRWLRSLPSHLQWTSQLNTGSSNIASSPSIKPSNPMICQLHLLYNFIEVCVLKPYTSSTVRSIHQRSTAVATHITRLVAILSENPVWIFNYAFTINALIESTLMHLRDCSHENLNLARHARFMFQQAMHTTKSLLGSAKTDRCISRITEFVAALDQGLTEADANSTIYLDEEEVMTPFALGSLNARYGEEGRQQWSKLNYFANGLVTPPTVKSKSISMSSSMFVPTAPFHGYGGHSAITDNILQTSSSLSQQQQPSAWKMTNAHMSPSRFQFSKAHSNPFDFLNSTTASTSSDEAWQQSRHTEKSKATSSVNNSSNKQSTYHQHAPSDLLTTNTDIAALVAQIQDTNNNNHNSDGSSNSSTNETQARPPSQDWNTSSNSVLSAAIETRSDSNNTIHDNENLFFTLLSSSENHHHRTTNSNNTNKVNSNTTTTSSRRSSEPRQYMQPYMNVGLGIYASAHQHHNDVIRQHLPNSTNTNNRPVMLSHQQQTQTLSPP